MQQRFIIIQDLNSNNNLCSTLQLREHGGVLFTSFALSDKYECCLLLPVLAKSSYLSNTDIFGEVHLTFSEKKYTHFWFQCY